MLAKGKRDLIAAMWEKKLRMGTMKPTDTETRSYGTLFQSSKVGKAGLIHSKPSQGGSHR